MRITCLIAWIIFLVAHFVASEMHERKLERHETTDRKGRWEMVWFGCACCAISDAFFN